MWMRRLMMFLVVLGTFPSLSEAAITIDVRKGIAPDLTFSPTKIDWAMSVRDYYMALWKGQTPSEPSDVVPNAFKPAGSTVDPWYLIETKQASNGGAPFWKGVFNPTGVYAGQYGSALNTTFGVKGNGQKIMAKNLGFIRDSNDPGNRWDFTLTNEVINYGPYLIGVVFGTGGAPDTFITSGSNTQLVDAVIDVGGGTQLYSENFAGSTVNEKVNNTYNYLASMMPFSETTTATYRDSTGAIVAQASATASIAVPEPSVSAFALVVLGSLGFKRRNRR